MRSYTSSVLRQLYKITAPGADLLNAITCYVTYETTSLFVSYSKNLFSYKDSRK